MRLTGSTIGRAAIALIPTWLLAWWAAGGAAPLDVRVLTALLAAISFLSAREGLLIIGYVAPLADLLRMAFELPVAGFTEAVVVAFLAGFLLRPAGRRTVGPAPTRALALATWAVSALLVASVVTGAVQARAHDAAAFANSLHALAFSYFDGAGDPFGAVTAARVLEGFALAAAVIALLRRSPILAMHLPDAMGSACIVAAAAAVLQWRGIGFVEVLERNAQLGTYRIAAHVADVNAAGSYFALMLLVAIGMAARDGRRRRTWWALVALSAATGLWMSMSLSAFAAVAVVLVAGVIPLVATLRRRTDPRMLAMAAAAVCAVALIGILGAGRFQAYASHKGSGFRSDFAQASYRMIHARPWFGVGIGRYYPDSPLFLSPELAFVYGAENAHDYFLQLAAETGLLGFAAFVALLASAAAPVARRLSAAPHDYRLWGLAGGVAAFLITCVTGHPLLVPEVAYPFWLAIGLMVALAAPAVDPALAPQGAATRLVALAAAALLIASVPVRARYGLPQVRRGLAVEGTYPWQNDGAVRYQWTEPYGSIFIDATITHVEIPMRAPWLRAGEAPTPIDISTTPGQRPARYAVGREWTLVPVNLSDTDLTAWHRINVHTTAPWVPGTPVAGVPPGTPLGVQVGEIREVDER